MISLQRIDPDKGMYRFYAMSLQPDLFGGCQLIRVWGRIGSSGGQERHQAFDDETSATAQMLRLEAAKRRKGYC